MAYLGCSTWSNRARWMLLLLFLAAGIILSILHTRESSKCVECTVQDDIQVCTEYKEGKDADWAELEGCDTTWLIATAAAFMASFLLCTVVTVSMCFAEAPLTDTPAKSRNHQSGSLKQLPCAILVVNTKAPHSSGSQTAAPIHPYASGQLTPNTPLTPLAPAQSGTSSTSVTPHMGHSAAAPSRPRQRSPIRSPIAETGASVLSTKTHRALGLSPPAASDDSSRNTSVWDGMLAEQALSAVDLQFVAAKGKQSTAHAQRAGTVHAGADGTGADAVAVAEAAAEGPEGVEWPMVFPLGSAEDENSAATHGTAHPSPYVQLDSDESCEPVATPTMTSSADTRGHTGSATSAAARSYVTLCASAPDLLALEPAAVSGGPGRSAEDVLKCWGRADSAVSRGSGSERPNVLRSSTSRLSALSGHSGPSIPSAPSGHSLPYGAAYGLLNMLSASVGDLHDQVSGRSMPSARSMPSVRSMRSRSSYDESVWVAMSNTSHMNELYSGSDADSLGAESPAKITVAVPQESPGVEVLPEISLQISGLGPAAQTSPAKRASPEEIISPSKWSSLPEIARAAAGRHGSILSLSERHSALENP